MKQFFLTSCTFFLLLIFNSCKTEVAEVPNTNIDTIEKPISNQNEPITEESAPENPKLNNYKWLLISGNLGLYESTVMIDLKIQDGIVTGRYFYARHQKFLNLDGTIDKNGTIKLKESYKGKTTGYFNLSTQKSEWKGTWSAKKDFSDPQNFKGKIVEAIEEASYTPKFERFKNDHTISVYNSEIQDGEQYDVTDDLMVNRISPTMITFYYHVTGVNGHIGSIEGVAHKNDNGIWIFKGEDNCTLTLEISDKEAIIEEDQCQYYRGARAYFDNTMKRVKS